MKQVSAVWLHSRGWVLIDLMVACAVFLLALLPIARELTAWQVRQRSERERRMLEEELAWWSTELDWRNGGLVEPSSGSELRLAPGAARGPTADFPAGGSWWLEPALGQPALVHLVVRRGDLQARVAMTAAYRVEAAQAPGAG